MRSWLSQTAQATEEQRSASIDDETFLFHEILSDLSLAYVDKVEPDKLFETGMRAMLGSLDPYTEFENNKDAENLQIATYGCVPQVSDVEIGTEFFSV